MGRPSEFDQEIASDICERIADGERLRPICASADTLFDEMLDIADDARNDWMERNGKDDAGWEANGEHIQRSKLRLEARKWMAGKLRPKKYGDKITQEHTGADGGPVMIQRIERVIKNPVVPDG